MLWQALETMESNFGRLPLLLLELSRRRPNVYDRNLTAHCYIEQGFGIDDGIDSGGRVSEWRTVAVAQR